MIDEIDIETWATDSLEHPLPEAGSYKVRLWDTDGFDEKRRIDDATPTGRQILDAFDRTPANEHVLLMLTASGLEEVRLDENINIEDRRAERFFAFRNDRLFKVVLEGTRIPWGAPSISVQILRVIFRVPSTQDIVLEQSDTPDKILDANDHVDLTLEGVERLKLRKRAWKLKVQGILLTILTPVIVVRDALIQAGIDPDTGWTAALKFKDSPREPIGLDDVIDLTRDGIEKLWLRPNEINNGESASAHKLEFSLRDTDVSFLERRGLTWSTIVEGSRRWLIVHEYPLPLGYKQTKTDIAVEIPDTYPAAMLDMFYCFPHLELNSSKPITQTDSRQQILGAEYQRWSRHRHGQTQWNPLKDSVISHIGIIDESINREVEL
jgi:hypothetical protein